MDRLDELRRVRLEKLARIRELGEDPYPHCFHRTHLAQTVLDDFEKLEEKEKVVVAGRMMSFRAMGKTSFAHIQDSSGKIQIFLRRDDLPEGRYALLKQLDLGDIIGIEGVPFRTRTGEISVRAESLTLLCKAIVPLPVVKEKEGRVFDSVTDKEHRYRNRHIDLLVNPEARVSLEKRSKIIRALREFLDERDFLEVETPVLQRIYGGAMAKPFMTHHNALTMDLYLRIALELYLKRLVIGGIERVYELGRTFRNEGMDKHHNPEFTLLEFYWAYADYNDAMDLVEEMIRFVAEKATGGLKLNYDGNDIDLSPPFRRVTMAELVREHTGIDIENDADATMLSWLTDRGEKTPELPGRGPLIEYLFEVAAEPKLIQPTFVMDYPRMISPLTKAHRELPESFVERFELFIGATELANAFTELNDPIDQRKRLEQQGERRAMGDEEAQQVDDEFLAALEQGMPPSAGVGIGVDRLVMFMTGETNIRDVLYFPHMRPVEGMKEDSEES